MEIKKEENINHELHRCLKRKIVNEFFNLCTKHSYHNIAQDISKELLSINIEDLCLREAELCWELLEEYLKLGKLTKKNKEKLKLAGERIYDLSIPIAVFIDIFNTLCSRISNLLNKEGIPSYYLDEFKNFQEELLNSFAEGFLSASIRNKEKYGKLLPPDSRDLFLSFLRLFKEPYKENHNILNKIENRINSLFIQILSSRIEEINIVELYELVKKYFSIFKKYYKNKKLPAFIIYEQAIDIAEKIVNIYSSLNSQKKYIDLVLLLEYIIKHPEKNWRLILFDPSKISFINKVYGFTVGDAIFDKLMEAISKYFPEDEKTAIFKCKRGLICVLTTKEVDSDISKLSFDIEHYIKHKHIKLDISVSAIDISISKGKNLSRKFSLEELEELISFLIRTAKKDEKKYLKVNTDNIALHKKVIQLLHFQNYVIEKIEKGEISIAVQPIVNLENRKVEHHEILFRILNNNTYIPAYEVIDMLYEAHIIHKLDIAVLKKILDNIHILKENNINSIFINISPNTLKTKDSFDKVKHLILEISSQIQVGIEITEQALLENHEVLEDLFKNTKIPISIDDFGAGYSSFSRLLQILEKLPLKFLKIDGSYVKEVAHSKNSEVLIKTINTMAHSLKLKTIAEFVENENMMKILQKLKVDYGQGYLFSKPKIIIP